MSERLRVFLVDDHDLFRAGVRAEIGEHVDLIGEADDVAGAIELIPSADPDVVLLDVHLPRRRRSGGDRGGQRDRSRGQIPRHLGLRRSRRRGRRGARRSKGLCHKVDPWPRVDRRHREDRFGGRGVLAESWPDSCSTLSSL